MCGPAVAHDGIWRVLAEMAARDPDTPPGDRFVPSRSAALDAWLTEVVATLTEAVAGAIDVEPSAALAFVCGQSGSIRLSSVRVDITFPLAAHPIALRRAGLDRNPGWVPSTGRVIEFHYD